MGVFEEETIARRGGSCQEERELFGGEESTKVYYIGFGQRSPYPDPPLPDLARTGTGGALHSH